MTEISEGSVPRHASFQAGDRISMRITTVAAVLMLVGGLLITLFISETRKMEIEQMRERIYAQNINQNVRHLTDVLSSEQMADILWIDFKTVCLGLAVLLALSIGSVFVIVQYYLGEPIRRMLEVERDRMRYTVEAAVEEDRNRLGLI